MVLHCYICKLPVASDANGLCKHLKSKHAMHYVGMDVQCGQQDCLRHFTSFSALRIHINKSHYEEIDIARPWYTAGATGISGESDRPRNSSCEDLETMEGFTDTGDFLGLETEIEEDLNITLDLPKSVMTFMTNIQSRPGVTHSITQAITENLHDVLKDVSEVCKQHILKMCKELSIDQSTESVAAALNEFSQIPLHLESVDTEYKRLNFLKDEGYYIEPTEIVLGTRQEARFDSKYGFSKTVLVEETFQYIQLEVLLKRVLENNVAAKLFENANQKQYCDKITDFRDTPTFATHPLFSKFPKSLQLHLFIDAFETRNELGSHTSVHKLEGLYMVVRNFPPQYLSKLSSIFLVALWHYEDVKKYGYEKLLAPVVSSITLLENEGICVDVNNTPTLIRGTLVLFSADNLGAHSIFGFLESFTANKFCRFCEATKDAAQDKFLESDFELRTQESYNVSVEHSGNPTYDPSATGIKKGCVLNDIPSFHVTANYAPDAMHDLLEGIVPLEVKLVVDVLIQEQYFTLDELNLKIQHFDYGPADRNSKPPIFTNRSTIRLCAAEAWCLIRNLPLIIGSKIPRGEPHWSLLLLLIQIMNIIFAPAVTPGLCEYLRQLICDHHTMFRNLFPNRRLLPKHHFLIYYPRCMVLGGPPCRYWCMRFEAKHHSFKQDARGNNCFKNICKSLAKKAQLHLASVLFSDRLLQIVPEVGPCYLVTVSNLPETVAIAVFKDLALSAYETVYVVNWLKLGHYKFTPNCFVVCSTTGSVPQFAKVLSILTVGASTYFIIQIYETLWFDDHFNAYEIRKSNHETVCFATSGLKDYHPVHCQDIIYEGMSHQFCILRYHLV